MQSRRRFLTTSGALAASGWALPARSQSWPQRPVRIIVPFPAGGNSDAIARVIAQHLGDAFGQQFVVESRAGAGGAIGAEAVARAAPDLVVPVDLADHRQKRIGRRHNAQHYL